MLCNYGYKQILRLCNSYYFFLQQLLHKRAWILRYIYIAFAVPF